MEVIVSLAIFVLAFIALHAMVNMSGERAIDIQEKSETAHRCQSKMAEVMAGVVPLQSQSDQAFEDNPDYSWSMECSQANVANLWTVTIHVTRARKDGKKVETSLAQMVLDPSVRGSTFDTVSISSSSSGSGGQGGSSPSGGSSTPSSGGTSTPAGGGGGGTAKGGTTTPGTGTGKGTTSGTGTGKGTTTTPGTGTGKSSPGTGTGTGTGKSGASAPSTKGG
jgi:hypothetical protein